MSSAGWISFFGLFVIENVITVLHYLSASSQWMFVFFWSSRIFFWRNLLKKMSWWSLESFPVAVTSCWQLPATAHWCNLNIWWWHLNMPYPCSWWFLSTDNDLFHNLFLSHAKAALLLLWYFVFHAKYVGLFGTWELTLVYSTLAPQLHSYQNRKPTW